MQKNDNNGPDLGGPFKETRQHLRFVLALAQILGLSLAPWTRQFGKWGDRFVGFHMALGWLSIPVFAVFYPQEDPGPLVAVWIVTAVMLLLHKVKGVWLRHRGFWVPSTYSGPSWIPGDEWRAKGVWEPMIALILGLLACFIHAGVGTWLLTAGLAQGFAVALAKEEERAVIRAARDARARAQYEMDVLRKELGEE